MLKIERYVAPHLQSTTDELSSEISFVIIVINVVGILWDISIYPCHKNLILGHKQNFIVEFEWLLVPNPCCNFLTGLWRCFGGVIFNRWELAERVQIYSIRYAYYDQWIFLYLLWLNPFNSSGFCMAGTAILYIYLCVCYMLFWCINWSSVTRYGCKRTFSLLENGLLRFPRLYWPRQRKISLLLIRNHFELLYFFITFLLPK